MSSFPAEELTFLRLVEQTFLMLKGSGHMLSPKDVELVRGWEGSGVPVSVVCGSLEASFEAFRRANGDGASSPRSLAYCAPAVEEGIRGWLARRVVPS
jgi:hypothetical protein